MRLGPFDGGVAFGFRGGDIGVLLDARDIRPAHVGDVFVLVADFLDGEGNDFQAHLVHVLGAGGPHAVGHHLRLLDDFFHRQLADDAAQVAFHHQPDQRFAFLLGLGQELLRRGLNGFRVRFDFDLGHGFHRDGHALFGVEVLLRGHIERHQFQRKLPAAFHHGKNHGAVPLDDPGPAESVNHQRLMRAGFAIKPGK